MFIAALVLSVPAKGAGDLSAHSAILLDAMSGRVLYEKRADDKHLIASTTKIMTGLLICEQCSPASPVKIPKSAVGVEGSSLYLQEGEILSVKELLYGLLLRSGNDAAVALALYCDGSVEAFADRMNEKAEDLGLYSTHFANPHGLDSEENYSTARDLATLAAYAMENELFREICATKTMTMGNRVLQNHNKLLWNYEGAVGVKTGFTKAAGRILVSAAEKNGRRLIAVTLQAPNDWKDHAKLLDYGFTQFESRSVVDGGEIIRQIPVLSGKAESVSIVAEESVSCPVKEGETLILRYHVPRFVYAPVEKHTLAGYIEVLVDGDFVFKIPLTYEKTVEQSHKNKFSLFRSP